jgi:NADH-quinone oxidoreductase subunit C
VTTNPPDESGPAVVEPSEDAPAASAVAAFAARVAELAEADSWSADFGNAKVRVDRSRWVEAVESVRDGAGLAFFSFLSAIDWSNEVAVGEPLEEAVEERYEILVRLSSGKNNDSVTLSTDLPKDDARIPTLSGVFGGANWHEREAAEMFGIEFEGHPNLSKLYLTDEFEGHPLRKTFPLLSREIKPWPGMVDVEDMPSTDNAEGDAAAASPDPEAPSSQQPAASSEVEAGSGQPEAGSGSPEGEQ